MVFFTAVPEAIDMVTRIAIHTLQSFIFELEYAIKWSLIALM